MGPSCGTSWILSIARIWSSVSIEGERPPCKQKICDETRQQSKLPVRVPGNCSQGTTATATTIDDTDLIVDQRGQGQVIEQVGEKLPNVGVSILSQTFVVEPVDLGDLPRLVVPTEDGHSIPVTQFEGDEQGDRLDRVVTPVDIVTHEEVIGIGRISTDTKELGKVVLYGSKVGSCRVGGESYVSCPSLVLRIL